ncbi:hypothetical protein [Staphylococcus phage SpP]
MKHPFLTVYSYLNDDEVLADKMSTMRTVNEEDENMIFTFDVREEYQKQEYSPIIRMTPISNVEAVWSDDNSEIHELVFSVELFTKSVNNSYELSSYIVDKLKNEHNCICINENLQYDELSDLYNSFMRFKIFITKGEI